MRINNFNFSNQYPLKFLVGSLATLSALVAKVAAQSLNSTRTDGEINPSLKETNVERMIIGGSIFSIGIILILCALKKANDFYKKDQIIMVMSFDGSRSKRNSLDLVGTDPSCANAENRRSVLVFGRNGYTYHTRSGSFLRVDDSSDSSTDGRHLPGSTAVELPPIAEE
ncbi:MAG: hypothetical protein JXA94_04210 [Parachlamydiales bacterium]|nr:hypothetical protein [Parachlamydiales bacterium]